MYAITQKSEISSVKCVFRPPAEQRTDSLMCTTRLYISRDLKAYFDIYFRKKIHLHAIHQNEKIRRHKNLK